MTVYYNLFMRLFQELDRDHPILALTALTHSLRALHYARFLIRILLFLSHLFTLDLEMKTEDSCI